MKRNKTIVGSAIVLVAIVGLGWVGNALGRRSAKAGWFQSKSTSTHSAIGDFSKVEQLDHLKVKMGVGSVARLADDLESLMEGDDRLLDFGVKMRLHQRLAGLDVETLEELFVELQNRGVGDQSELLEMTLLEWARRNATAAFTAVAERPMLAMRIFDQWANEALEQAFAWLDSEDLPDGLRDEKEAMRGAALMRIVNRDFNLAMTQFLKLPSHPRRSSMVDRERIVKRLAGQCFEDPELRQRLVDFLNQQGAPEDQAALHYSLVSDWPQADDMGLLTHIYELKEHLERASFPQGKGIEVEASAVGAAIYREYDGPALEWWMGRHADTTEVPEALRSAMEVWYEKYPEKVSSWFEGQADSPQRDSLLYGLIPTIAVSDSSEAERMMSQITDPQLRDWAAERLDYMTSASSGGSGEP